MKNIRKYLLIPKEGNRIYRIKDARKRNLENKRLTLVSLDVINNEGGFGCSRFDSYLIQSRTLVKIH